MKTVLLSNAISSFFSRHDLYFHSKQDCRSTRLYSPFFYIYCYFGQIFCTEVIQFFSVENLGHKELKKSSKYKLVDFLDEKRRFTFAIFLLLFIQGLPLTHNAMLTNQKSIGDTQEGIWWPDLQVFEPYGMATSEANQMWTRSHWGQHEKFSKLVPNLSWRKKYMNKAPCLTIRRVIWSDTVN